MGIGEKDAKNRNKNKKNQDPSDPNNIGRYVISIFVCYNLMERALENSTKLAVSKKL
eukprot:04544.XXX_131216_81121_1 [CDS] Oithona nana genome sequencing.